MIQKKQLRCVGALLVAISLFCTGCQGQAGTDEKETSASQTSAGEQMNTEAQTQETTQGSSQGETPDWESAKVSGDEAAFAAYFDVDIKPYVAVNEKAGTLETVSYHSNVVGANRDAYVYLPYGYDENQSYPVVYLIHGIGCDGGQWTSMGACRMFDNLIANGTIAPCIAVFPSVIPKDGIDKNTLSAVNIDAFTTFVTEFKVDLVPYLQAHYAVSDAREDHAICGLSMGGMEALRLGFTYLDQFAFIGSFSAAPTLEMELLTTEGSDFTPELVLVCTGDQDNTVGDNPKNYHLELTKNGVEHIWYQHPGQSHSPTVWNLGLYNFLTRLSGGFTPSAS